MIHRPAPDPQSDRPARAFGIITAAIRRRLGVDAAGPAASDSDLGPELRHQAGWHRVRGFLEADPLTRPLLEGGAVPAGSARDRLTAQVIELTVILGRLRRAGIPSIPLKGVLLSARLHGDPTLRGCHDHDVLVAPERLDDAIAALAPDYLPDAYSRRTRAALEHHEILRPVARGSLVELHWRLLNPYSGYAEAAGIAWASPRTRQDAGLSYLALDAAVEAVMVSVHAAHHFGVRLHWLADVAALTRQLDEGEWARAIELAGRWRVRRAMLTAVAAAGLTLRIPLSPILARAVQDGASGRSASWIAERLTAGRTAVPSQFHGWPHRSAMLEDWKARLRVIPRLAFTPIPEDHAATGLPRWAGLLTAAARPILIMGRALRRTWQ